MSGYLANLKERLSQKRHTAVPSTLEFPPLDADDLARELRLEKRGRENGRRGLPSAQTDGLDDVESEIITRINNNRHQSTDRFNANLHYYADRISGLDLDAARHEVDRKGINTVSEINRDFRYGLDHLYTERANVIELENEMAHFRATNGLTKRTARYPDAKIYQWAIFGFLFLAEAILNGTFLGETHTLGIMGGVMEACAIAGLNLILGVGAGAFGIKQMIHVRGTRKLGGFVVLCALVAMMLALNVLFAHYRSALAMDFWENAYQVAWSTFTASPLDISDMKSWLLALIGMIFFTIAMVDVALFYDDPYPRYGNLWRKLEESRAHYAEEKQEHIEPLEEKKNRTLTEFMEARESLNRARQDYHQVISSRQRHVENYRNHISHLEGVANTLLNVYRIANRDARPEDDPPPPHFNRKWEIAPPDIPEFKTMNDRQMQVAVNTLDDALKNQIDAVVQAYDQSVNSYELIENFTLEDIRRARATKIIKAA